MSACSFHDASVLFAVGALGIAVGMLLAVGLAALAFTGREPKNNGTRRT